VRRLVFVAISATAMAAAAQAVDLQVGLWEVSTKSERGGVVTQRPVRTLCIAPDKAKEITAQVAKALPTDKFSSRNTTCKIVDLKVGDKEVAWRTQCTGQFPAEQTGRYVVENPQHYTNTVRSSVKVAQKTLSSTLTTEGRRTGECPK